MLVDKKCPNTFGLPQNPLPSLIEANQVKADFFTRLALMGPDTALTGMGSVLTFGPNAMFTKIGSVLAYSVSNSIY